MTKEQMRKLACEVEAVLASTPVRSESFRRNMIEGALYSVWDKCIEECAKAAENTPTELCQNGQFMSERCAKAIRAIHIHNKAELGTHAKS
jgi:hypothetical protein